MGHAAGSCQVRLLQLTEEHPDRRLATVLVDLFRGLSNINAFSLYRLRCSYHLPSQPYESWVSFIA